MSIERSLVARARPYMLATKTRAVLMQEESKGCRATISREPVALEPRFDAIHAPRPSDTDDRTSDAVAQPREEDKHLSRLRLWIPSDYTADWRRSERFLKELASVTHRVGFEILGNEKQVALTLLCHERDLPVIAAAFYGEFARCELSLMREDLFSELPAGAWQEMVFADYFPSPPYADLLTRPEELHFTPFESLIAVLARIPRPAIGLCQVLFQPVKPRHNWHHNVEVLTDLAYATKLFSGMSLPQHFAQQAPSGDLRQMAWQVEKKAHNDKPFFAAALRLAVVGTNGQGPRLLRALATSTDLYQHGGRPLNRITDRDYAEVFDTGRFYDMFTQGISYRAGFLVNSLELAGLVHLPPASILEHRSIPLETLDTLPAPSDKFAAGTRIGTRRNAGREIPIHIPDDQRRFHTHVIGRPGMGKSVLLEHMILQDIAKGDAVVVIDPHGDLVKRILDLVPESAIDRTIYFDPGDPDWVPMWNPLQRIPGQDMGRTADDLVSAFRSFVTGWGDRMERFLRELFYGLLHLPGSSLLDASNILQKSDRGERLKKQIPQLVDGEEPRHFWQHEFDKYGKDDLGPPKNKLSKLLVGETFPLMFSQPDCSINFRQIIDDGMVLLVDLSSIGSDNRKVLGCLMLSLISLTASRRSDTDTDQRRQAHVFCDEAHKFLTDALEDLIAEARKFGVSLTLAHQYLSQFKERRADALSSTGSTIIFNVDRKDAGHLTKDLRGLATADDLISLPKYEAILRAGTEVVRISTLEPVRRPSRSPRDRIVAESHRRYYKRATEVRAAIRRRRHGRAEITLPPEFNGEELTYGEL